MIPYTLIFEQRPGYLYACVKADGIDRETAVAYLTAVADKCRSLSLDRVVLERDIPVMLPSGDLFFTTNDFSQMMPGIRVAFLNPHAEIGKQLDFAMVIANNRGAQFTLCPDLPCAEEWLRSADETVSD